MNQPPGPLTETAGIITWLEKKRKKSDEGINKASKRGCLEEFGFQSQSSSLKKAKKEDLPNTESTFKVQDASEEEQSTVPEVFSKSSELEKRSQTAMNTNECESSSGIGFPFFSGWGLKCDIFSQMKSMI